jgi:hypothetical protein
MNELAPGSMSLEVEENPVAETPTAPEPTDAPAQTEHTPQQAADADPEGVVINPGGEKLVPLGALAAARQSARAEKEARERLEAEIAQVREKATKYDQVAGEWQAAQPLLQQLRNGTYQPTPPPAPRVNEQALQYAKDLDLYKPDGTPDVERAQRILNYNAAQAQEQAQRLVQPIYATHAQQQSQSNLQAALSFKTQNGVQADPEVVKQIWSMVPPELSSQPGVAAVLYKVALAESLTAGKTKLPTAAPPPPQFTESLGGGAPAPRELTAVDRAMMSAGGIKQKDYESISERFKPGQANSLE